MGIRYEGPDSYLYNIYIIVVKINKYFHSVEINVMLKSRLRAMGPQRSNWRKQGRFISTVTGIRCTYYK